jgi:hypothetical protein
MVDETFLDKGKKIGEIPVRINYRIIELFSAGLYSSPHKAFEELVSNSYDANAKKVSVYIPTELNSDDSFIFVCDNGTSMNSVELKNLWKIGESNKRDNESNLSRKPIGKFGIGKLATYVLANRLTYICKKEGEYKRVTMDYSEIDPNSDDGIKLSEILLTEEEAKEILTPLIKIDQTKLINFNLFGSSSENSWTIAIMSKLKEPERIKEGPLKWVLSTALPLSPNFNLFYNGTNLESSKSKGEKLNTWIFGKEDDVVNREDEYNSYENEGEFFVNLPNLKNIKGYAELYKDSLVRGKSQDMGRSHGIFLMIRDRLINIDNPLIGSVEELNHATFNRCRIVIQADELDMYLTSGRESVKECPAYSDLQKYIKQKFNKVKSFFDDYINKEDLLSNAGERVSHTSSLISKKPILVMAKKFLLGNIDEPLLTSFEGISSTEKEKFIEGLEEDVLKENGGFVKDVEFSLDLPPEFPMAILDLKNKKVRINQMHPFFVNYFHSFKSTLPLQFFAVNEILTEASMYEQEIDSTTIRTIIKRRDQLLREITYEENPNAPAVAMMIKNALSNPNELEEAIFYGFKSLGFETTKIGGKGKPDGKAIARRGFSPEDKKVGDYSITYEAKSTTKDRIQNKDAKLSTCVRHRADYKSDYSVEVAIDFADSDNSDSAVNKEAKQQKVTLIRAKDFWKLILFSIPNQINFKDIKDFLDNCHTIPETSDWIEQLVQKEIQEKPIKEILGTTWELMGIDKKSAPTIDLVRGKNSNLMKNCSPSEIEDIIKSVSLLVPSLIYLDEQRRINLLTNPERILECLRKVVETQIPAEYIDNFEKLFEKKLNSSETQTEGHE